MMWHIVLIAYVFTTLMFAVSQGSLARIIIYLMVFTVLPTAFSLWVWSVRRRNKLAKYLEKQGKSLPD